MLSQREIEEIKNKRRRLRNESRDDDGDPHSLEVDDQRPLKRKGTDGQQRGFEKVGSKPELGVDDAPERWMDKDFVDEYVKMNESSSKMDDPWLQSLKTSEYDDTHLVYEKKPKPRSENDDKMDLLYNMPKVEVIRMLVSKLADNQTPSDYLKSVNYKDKKDTNSKPGNYQVSDLAHVLTMTWQNVYYMTREDIVDALMCYKNNNKELKRYEFRWEKDDLAVHGPYPHEDILMWIVYGYVSEENPILVRELDHNGYPYTHEWTHYKDSDIYNIFPSSNDQRRESKGDVNYQDSGNQEEEDEYYQDEGDDEEEQQGNEEGEDEDEEEDYYQDEGDDEEEQQGNEEGEDEDEEEDYYKEAEGFRSRKKSKLIGMDPKMRPNDLENDDDEDEEEEEYYN